VCIYIQIDKINYIFLLRNCHATRGFIISARALFPPHNFAVLPCWYCQTYGVTQYKDRVASNGMIFIPVSRINLLSAKEARNLIRTRTDKQTVR